MSAAIYLILCYTLYISYVGFYILSIDAVHNRMMHPKVFRAPEIILTGSIKDGSFSPPKEPVLTSGIDVWAMACLFVRMSSGILPFGVAGDSYVDIRGDIVDRLGAPSQQQCKQWGTIDAYMKCILAPMSYYISYFSPRPIGPNGPKGQWAQEARPGPGARARSRAPKKNSFFSCPMLHVMGAKASRPASSASLGISLECIRH